MSVAYPLAQRTEPAVPSEVIWRLSVSQYHDMIRAGILTDEDPVELLEGWLVPKMTKTPLHTLATQLTREALDEIVPAGWFVNDQELITLEESEPEPDVSVVRGDRRTFLDRHPSATEVGLAVEASESSLGRDRTIKKQIYAQARIPFFWIVNLASRCLEVFSEPAEVGGVADYKQLKVYRLEDFVSLILDGKECGRLKVASLFP